MKFVILFFILFFSESCILRHSDDSIPLGNNYRYIQDYPTIIYDKNSRNRGEGVTVVPPIVKSYKYNDKYIIAKSQANPLDSLSLLYWIIDRNTGLDTTMPTKDIDAFKKRLKELKIDLELD